MTRPGGCRVQEYNKTKKQRNQLVRTVGPMIDQPDKNAAFCSNNSKQSSKLKEDIKYLSLLNASHKQMDILEAMEMCLEFLSCVEKC